jgi:hypothetical protein
LAPISWLTYFGGIILMPKTAVVSNLADLDTASGEFLTIGGERYYAIRRVDKLAPFFISVISSNDHWMFISSTGGLSAGRVSPETALFPYITVDRIHESTPHTGSKTILRVSGNGEEHIWEPYHPEHGRQFDIQRNLFKNLLGNKLCFEEVNHDLQLAFRYTWLTSSAYGHVRQCELTNLGTQGVSVDLLDGLQNIIPAGTPRVAQTNSSNLVDAYKWTELDVDSGLGIFSLYSGISDRAEPAESLRANTIFCLGMDDHKVLLSSTQVKNFRAGKAIETETNRRGIRGAYFVNKALELAAGATQRWQFVADVEQSHSKIADLCVQLENPAAVSTAITQSVQQGSDALARIMASGDGFQATHEENVSTRHYASVLFNILRGGVFDDQYTVSSQDFIDSVRLFNCNVYVQNETFLASLPIRLGIQTLLSTIEERGDKQLLRLCYEYLPITFGRRHGDPSRPWNHFSIKLRDDYGNSVLSYQGNWRDIFQNWEALAFSFPEYIENFIAKFVNASTMDGYNPYRITKEGIDWEIEEEDDPWSYIGYWGDHQIIYLQKFLELSRQFHPTLLGNLLRQPIFSYANVPYKIVPFELILKNPKQTVNYDHELAAKIEARVAKIGADGKLILDGDENVLLVNLFEKLLVTLLGKLSNLVIDGGIWLNTQRPEWNDANNALVGQGLSMVTLYYMRRYVRSLQQLLETEPGSLKLSREVASWLQETAAALKHVRPLLGIGPISPGDRYVTLRELGEAASDFRAAVYGQESLSGTVDQSLDAVHDMLGDALAAIDHSINTNKRDDGLFNAYNLIQVQQGAVTIDPLYPMLEGQVAVLSAGTIGAKNAVSLIEALFKSDIYRPDQRSFMLYPDRKMIGFMSKNCVPAADVEAIPLLKRMLDTEDRQILTRDVKGVYRFNAEFSNIGDLNATLDRLAPQYGDELELARGALQLLYEKVFNHRAFTGRSGGMFGFEGLGCIYWHMVSKLLLAVQENFYSALESDSNDSYQHELGRLYYRVRDGIGFNKTPAEFGAFPTDPYSHTPKHSGARQPGMTGQVKEEILCRFGELGVRVDCGAASFRPTLLRQREFVNDSRLFRYLDVDDNWQEIGVPENGLAFSWCQMPIVYRLSEKPLLTILRKDGSEKIQSEVTLSADDSADIFKRSGRIRQVTIAVCPEQLFID